MHATSGAVTIDYDRMSPRHARALLRRAEALADERDKLDREFQTAAVKAVLQAISAATTAVCKTIAGRGI